MTKASDDKKSQLERFKETAKQVETDDSAEAFDRALSRVAKRPVDWPPPGRPKPKGN